MHHRQVIQSGLAPVVGEEATEALLAQFPVREADEPATKEFVEARVAEVRADIADVRVEIAEVRADVAELRGDMGELRGDLTARLAQAGTKTDVGLATLDKKIDVGLATLDKKIDVGLAKAGKETADLRTEVHEGFANLDKKIDVGLASLEKKIDVGLGQAATALEKALRRQTRWVFGIVVGATALLAAVDKFLP